VVGGMSGKFMKNQEKREVVTKETIKYYVNLLQCYCLIFSLASCMSQQGSLVQTCLFPLE
jgi:hypothetical protein